MKVSVIIPVYNGKLFLREAIDSVLEQCIEALDIIVVDDGSTDSCGEIARLYGPAVRLLQHEKNRGPSAARNTGIREAYYDILAFLDADDWWVKDSLVRRLEYLQNDPSMDVVLGATKRTLHEGGAKICSSVGAAIFRKKVFETVGLFDESLRYGEDGDLFLRIKEQHMKVGFLQDVVQVYRMHENNSTKEKKVFEKGILEMLHRSIRRKCER